MLSFLLSKTGTLIADFLEIKYKSPNYILQYFEQKVRFRKFSLWG